jgi:hypothetical protein
LILSGPMLRLLVAHLLPTLRSAMQSRRDLMVEMGEPILRRARDLGRADRDRLATCRAGTHLAMGSATNLRPAAPAIGVSSFVALVSTLDG